MGRDRKLHPKRNPYCLRLTDKQKILLQRYAEFRDYPSEVDAVRGMIDGLEGWFHRQLVKSASLSNNDSGLRDNNIDSGLLRPRFDSGLPPPIDVTLSDDAIDVEEGASVGDFAGRPSVGLPESRHIDD